MMKTRTVNITKIHEDRLLEHLDKADWVITLPEGLPNLTFTTQWRRTLQEYSGKQFVRWVMEGIDRVFTNDYDPPWDHSGTLRNVKTDSMMLLVRHDLLSSWAKNEFTGQSEATYESGYGLQWTTYEEDIRRHVERQVNTYVAAHCMNTWRLEDEVDVFADERWDMSDIPLIISLLSFALLENILQLSSADAWKQFEDDIRAENEARRKKAEQYQHMQKQVTQFWEVYFPDLMDIRIEMPLSDKSRPDCNFSSRLQWWCLF
jgi:hypothetical protein